MDHNNMQVKSIQCSNCAAPLSLHGGGHRIRSLTCEYCGAVMDVRKDFALLGQFKDQHQPVSPLTLGAEGKIKDIHFVVIGMIEYRSNYGDRWTDLHLFSETHGYAWLSYQLGHFTFTRRVRILPDRDMKKLSPRSTLRVRGEAYKFLEAYQAEIIYVSGELTWVANLGDTTVLRDSIAPPFMFSLEETENEQEYHLTEYIDPDVIKKSFELSFDTHRSFVHPAQPFKAPIRKALSKASLIPMGISLLIIFFISFLNMGNTVFSERITQQQISGGIYIGDFKVTNAKHLMELQFENAYPASFRIKDIAIFDEKNEVFAFGRSRFKKTTSAINQNGSARFHINETGKYTLRLRAATPSISNNNKQPPYIKMKIQQGILVNRYFKYLLYLSIISFLLFYIARLFFEKKRWD